ncbi:MAG TPA: DUF4129 domain-containing protein [Spirillospora sp.]
MGASDPVGRDEAREMARRELEKQVYQRDKPSLLERAWDAFAEWLQDLLSRTPQPESQNSGSGWVSVTVVVIIAVIAVVLVVWLMWNRRNPRSRQDPLLEDEPSTALDHRDAAELHAAEGRWAEAIRERLRAIARDLEERAVLTARPGRTADELADEAGRALPELAEDLHTAVRIFDDVWYGDRPGTAEGYATVTDVDDRLQKARPKPLEHTAADEEGGPRW